jgi:hypothetical protein
MNLKLIYKNKYRWEKKKTGRKTSLFSCFQESRESFL